MSQPPPYDRQFNFQNQQLQTPADPLPADEIDSEYNAIKLTLDATLANLELIQRDDGQLANETVGVDQLKPELVLLGDAAASVLTAAAEVEADRAAAEVANAAAQVAKAAAEVAKTSAEAANTTAQAAKTAAELAETNAETAETNAETAEAGAQVAQIFAEGAQAVAEAASLAAAAAADKLQGSSSTSVSIGTGSKAFTTQSGKFFDPGTQLLITSDAAPATDYLHGVVTAYADTSLTVDVTDIGGSGAHTDWTIRVSGTRGSIGGTGVQGVPGTPGAPGIQFNFAASTADFDPGAGNFRFNTASPVDATALYIDNLEVSGADVSGWLDTFDDDGDAANRGNVQIINPDNPAVFYIFRVTGSVVDGAGYRKLAVTYLSGTGSFSAGENTGFAFFRRGPIGPTGLTGPTGDVSAAAAFATDERVLRSDGTGKGAQASTVALTDAGAMSGITTLVTSGSVTVGTTAGTAPIVDPSGFVQVPEIAAPATPASGHVRLYAKSDNKVYRKDDLGVETELGGGGEFRTQPGGRLTLSTGVPTMVATVAATGTLYYTPYLHNVIWLYDGSIWVRRTFSETSIALSAGTASKPHDVFAYDNAGTLALEVLAWTNDTTPATALVRQDGVLVKSGATTRLYLGTVYLDGSKQSQFKFGGTAVGGTAAVFDVWNMYNRREVHTIVSDSTALWNPAVGTASLNASTANRITAVIGRAEDFVRAAIDYGIRGGASQFIYVSIGYDSTTVTSGINTFHYDSVGYASGHGEFSVAPVGRHFFQGLEYSSTGGTVYGSTSGQGGMSYHGWY